MDRYGNQGAPEPDFRDKLANALGVEHVERIAERRIQNDKTRLSVANVRTKDLDRIRRDCGLCGRVGLKGFVAYWSHLKDGHATEIERIVSGRSKFGPETERFETALIRIVNATSLDEACEIATDVLLASEQGDGGTER